MNDDGGADGGDVPLVDGCDGHWDGDNVDVWQLLVTGHAAPGEERTEEKQMNVRYKKSQLSPKFTSDLDLYDLGTQAWLLSHLDLLPQLWPFVSSCRQQ